MKKPEDYIRGIIASKLEGYMQKAEGSCKSERGSEAWVKELKSSVFYKRACEWGALDRRQNILCIKEHQLDRMTRFLKDRDLYEDFCETLADE